MTRLPPGRCPAPAPAARGPGTGRVVANAVAQCLQIDTEAAGDLGEGFYDGHRRTPSIADPAKKMPSVVGLSALREVTARRRVDELREQADRIHAELDGSRNRSPQQAGEGTSDRLADRLPARRAGPGRNHRRGGCVPLREGVRVAVGPGTRDLAGQGADGLVCFVGGRGALGGRGACRLRWTGVRAAGADPRRRGVRGAQGGTAGGRRRRAVPVLRRR